MAANTNFEIRPPPQIDLTMIANQPNVDVRKALAAALKGQTIEMPNLHQYMIDWDYGINPHLLRLRDDVTRRLHTLFGAGPRLNGLLAADAGSFAAQWWPDAAYEQLQIATWLSIWLFAWDDETDSGEFSDVSLSLIRSKQFRRETIAWCRHCLGLGTHIPETPRDALLRSFDEVGVALCRAYDEGQRRRLLMEIETFVNMVEVEQLAQLSGHLPSLEAYQRTRMGTSAVNVCLAITEFSYGVKLPENIKKCPHMETLWATTNVIISTVNDIVSIRKEVANGQVDSLVPLLAHQLGSVQAAVDSAETRVKSATELFESVVVELETAFQHDRALPDLRLIIRNCRTACTANLHWSLASGRYKLNVTSLYMRPQIVI